MRGPLLLQRAGRASLAQQSQARWIARAGLVALLAGTIAFFALGRTYPNVDGYWHLVWARELLHGHAPSFQAPGAPSEHPLNLALAALGDLLGGDRPFVLISLLWFVALVAGVFRLGKALFGPWPGLVAAALVGSSFALIYIAMLVFVDPPFLALVTWAAALEVERPRRGWPVMALLALAGLVRPEAWALAALYFLRCWRGTGPGERARLAALAAAAPILWLLIRHAGTAGPATSSPLLQGRAPRHLPPRLGPPGGRPVGLGEAARLLVPHMADIVRAPVLAAGALGVVLAARLRPARDLVVPGALFAVGVANFFVLGAADYTLVVRYVALPAVVLAVFAGYAVAGFAALPDSRLRRAWAAASTLALVLGAAYAITQRSAVERLRDEAEFSRRTHDELTALLDRPAVRAGLRCRALTFPTRQLVPDAIWRLDRRDIAVLPRRLGGLARGVHVYVRAQVGNKRALRTLGTGYGTPRATNNPPPGRRSAAHSGPLVAYVSCP